MNIHYPRHKKFIFAPGKAALLIIDIQNYFTSKDSHAYVPSSAAIIPRINELASAFKKAGRPVIFTRHIDVDPTNLMNRWWKDSIREDDPKSEINSALDTSYGTIIIKHQYDAFYKTGLEEGLKERGVSQVVITGVVTHLCCETTARSAFMRDLEVFFVTDCTASFNPEHHNAAISNLAHGFAVPVTFDEICNIWGQAPNVASAK